MKGISEIKKVVIGGAGLMGASMAQIFAKWGYHVTMYDVAPGSIEKGKALAEINQRVLVEQGEISAEQSREILSRMAYTMEMDAFKEADFVVEAIIENMDIKLDFWKKVSDLAPEDIVLTTNTSGLSITKLAKVVKNPGRFCGMHWINPPHIVPLVEIIEGAETEKQALDITRDVAISVHKHPVIVHSDPSGFLLNRLQFAVLREAMHIVEKGYATAQDVDDVMKYGLGMRYSCIGPFETADLGGLDTFHRIASYLFAELSDEKTPHKLLADLYNEGSFGTKTGKGFYDYSNGGAERAIAKRDKNFLKVSKCLYENL